MTDTNLTPDSAGRMTQFTSLLDGTVDYTHDATGQLAGADYDYQADEAYTYDANGNRTNTGYTTGTNNQLLSDGTYNYEYDAEGNRVQRTEISTGHVTEYEWDHRNHLVRVVERDSDTGPATEVVEHTYDYLNRWVGRAVDSDGDGPLDFVDTYFVYDGVPSGAVLLDRSAVTTDNVGQIVLQFDDDAQGTPQLTHRYLWGPAVDQILADEAVTSLAAPGEILWPLPDHLGTARDLAQRDPTTGETTVANHRTFDSYGNLLTQTNPALDHLFTFTGRALDTSTSLQNNLNRWYDAHTGRWISQDPIGFEGGDGNLYRYVANRPVSAVDPSGLEARPPLPPGWVYDDAGRPCKESDLGWVYLCVDAPASSPRKAIEEAIDRAYSKSGSTLPKSVWVFLNEGAVRAELGGSYPETGHTFVAVWSPHKNLKGAYPPHPTMQYTAGGFYPTGNFLLSDGTAKYDWWHAWTSMLKFRASPETMQKVIDEFASLAGRVKYSVLDNNEGNELAHCTSFAVEVLHLAGLPIYLKDGRHCDPYDLEQHINKRNKPAVPAPP